MNSHDFTLVISPSSPLSNDDLDSLFEAGFGDVTFLERGDLVFAEFSREGESAADVIAEAIASIEQVLGATVVRVEPDDLVTIAGIADRTGRSREGVRLLVEGKRGPGGFPAPFTLVDARSRLWRWSDVAEWFELHLKEDKGAHAAKSLAAINTALQLRNQRDFIGKPLRETLEVLVGEGSLGRQIEKSERAGDVPAVAGSLLAIANPLLGLLGSLGVKRFLAQNPVSTAIDRTATVFTGVEVDHALRKWCAGAGFKELLQRVANGERRIDPDVLVDDFLALTDFFVADEATSWEMGSRLISSFLVILQEEIYNSPYGLAVKESRDEERHLETSQTLKQSLEATESLKDSMATLLQAVNTDQEKPAVSDNQKFHARVDVARDLLKAGKPTSAYAAASQIAADVASEGIDEASLLFRLATVLGSVHLELGNLADAHQQLTLALDYQDSADALSNLALIELLMGNFEAASRNVEKALAKDPEHIHAKGTQMSCLLESGQVEELELVAAMVTTESPSALKASLGVTRFKQGRYDDAQRMLRSSLRDDPANAQIRLYLGSVIFAEVQERLQADPPLYWRIQEDDLKRLNEAESEFSAAIRILEDQEGSAFLADALASRAAVRVMLGRDTEAIADVDLALERDPKHPIAGANKGLLLLAQGEASAAIPFLEQTYQADPSMDKALKLAQALGEADRASKIPNVLEPFLPDSVSQWDPVLADVLLHAYEREGLDDKITELRSQLLSAPGNAMASWVYARHLRRVEKDEDSYIERLRQAMTFATGNQRDRVAMDLAEALFFRNDFADAASLYREVVDPSSDDDIVRRYLTALYNSGSLKEALELARSLRESSGKVRPVVSEIEALVLAHIGDVESAKKLFLQLADIEEHHPAHLIQAAFLALEAGNKSEARRIIRRIDVKLIENDPRALMQLAHARSTVGESGVLPLAYRARRLGFDDPNIHLGYVNLFLRREADDEKLLNATVAGLDTTVHLVRGDTRKQFSIVHEEDGPRGVDDLSPDHPLAQKLIGVTKGEEITLKEGIEDLTYEVADVQSKYVFAFQQTLLEFGTRFSDHPGLQRLEMAGDDLTPLIRTLEAHRKRVKASLEVYQSRMLPVSTLAQLLGKHIAEVWLGLLNDSDQSVKVSSGAAPDFESELKAAYNTETLVLDETALLTIADLGLGSKLAESAKRVVVPQLVVDDLRLHSEEVLHGITPAGQLLGGDAGIAVDDFTQEQLEAQRVFYRTFNEFVEKELEVLAVETLLELSGESARQMEEAIGRPALSAILLAKELDGTLYSDDLALRMLGKTEFDVAGTWTQPVLAWMSDQGKIESAEHLDALWKLAASRCLYLRISPSDVLRILLEEGVSGSSRKTDFIESVFGTDYGDEYVIGMAADVIRSMWLEPVTNERKVLSLDLILSAITRDRTADAALGRLRSSLEARLTLLPTVQHAIFQTLDMWAQRNRILQGLT